mmetsp:Transcript_123384/g.356645  ORF Transcript_123384/g.356645 Transcript_123384/m.356645 type:complete len:220 (+) Transcript_123384:965-1624(+)
MALPTTCRGTSSTWHGSRVRKAPPMPAMPKNWPAPKVRTPESPEAAPRSRSGGGDWIAKDEDRLPASPAPANAVDEEEAPRWKEEPPFLPGDIDACGEELPGPACGDVAASRKEASLEARWRPPASDCIVVLSGVSGPHVSRTLREPALPPPALPMWQLMLVRPPPGPPPTFDPGRSAARRLLFSVSEMHGERLRKPEKPSRSNMQASMVATPMKSSRE